MGFALAGPDKHAWSSADKETGRPGLMELGRADGSEEGVDGRSCHEMALHSLRFQLHPNKNLSTYYSLRGTICVSQSKLWFDDVSCFTSDSYNIPFFFFFKASQGVFCEAPMFVRFYFVYQCPSWVKARFFQNPFLTLLLPKLTTWSLGWSEMVRVVGRASDRSLCPRVLLWVLAELSFMVTVVCDGDAQPAGSTAKGCAGFSLTPELPLLPLLCPLFPS